MVAGHGTSRAVADSMLPVGTRYPHFSFCLELRFISCDRRILDKYGYLRDLRATHSNAVHPPAFREHAGLLSGFAVADTRFPDNRFAGTPGAWNRWACAPPGTPCV